MKLPLSALMGFSRRVADEKRANPASVDGRAMRRWHVVRELFTRGRWEERPLPVERRVFKFRRDAEAVANYMHATRKSGLLRFTIARRPAP